MHTKRSILSLAVLVAVLGLASPARAATITVTTTADELNSDGDCSLREAIRSANSDGVEPHDACAAGSGADLITVPAGVITLDEGSDGEDAAVGGDLDITSNVTIDGAGTRSTFVDGADLDRVFHVISGTVTISDLTIRNGKVGNGAGVYNQGTLSLIQVAVSDNEGTADGAGLFNDGGTLTLTRSLVSNNPSATTGGGLSSAGGTVTLENTTFSGNSANCTGGGIVVFAGATLEANNTTIVMNEAAKDPAAAGCPPPANGGGIYITGATATVSNTVIGDNTDRSTGADPVHPDCSGTLTSGGYNLIEITTGCTITGTTTGNITGQDPRLDPLGDFGGPTLSHNPRKNSPVVDAGNPATPSGTPPACETTDQRGVTRPQGPRCDIGAVERTAEQQPVKTKNCQGRVPTIMGTKASELLVGTARKDVIFAGAGDDRIRAQTGSDVVCGGKGNDRVGGGAGNDSLRGQGGNDIVRGQQGRDALACGPGVDRGKGGPGRDTRRGCEEGRA